MPIALNAANEVAVDGFLVGLITFGEIPEVAARVLERHVPSDIADLAHVVEIDGARAIESMLGRGARIHAGFSVAN